MNGWNIRMKMGTLIEVEVEVIEGTKESSTPIYRYA